MEKGAMENIRAVRLWHEALNNKHKEGLAELVTENVSISGPKGDVEGLNIMLDWVDRANITLEPQRYFQSGNTIVVEEHATWHEAETENKIGSSVVASVFILDSGHITSIKRLDSLNKALGVAGLTEGHQVDCE